jgi:hypothetical protein
MSAPIPAGFIGKNMMVLILTNISNAIEELPVQSNARIGLTVVRDVLLMESLRPVEVVRTEVAV